MIKHVGLHIPANGHTAQILDFLMQRLNLNAAGVIRVALQRLAEQEGWRD